MSVENLARLLDDNPQIEAIELSNYGELFLNPQLMQILQLAEQRKVRLSALNGANLNRVEKVVLEGLVKYHFQALSCSIDGATNESYRKYRVGGNLDQVVENIRTINHFKRLYQSDYPLLKWQFIVFDHNSHEIEQAREMAATLDMEFCLKLCWDKELAPKSLIQELEDTFGATSRDEYRERTGADVIQKCCHQLWNQPQINWDGKILGCCRNFWGDFGGNAFSEGLVQSLNNPKIQYARQMLRGLAPAREDIPCTQCDIYQFMRSRDQWLRPAPRLLLLTRRYLPQSVKDFLKKSSQLRRWRQYQI